MATLTCGSGGSSGAEVVLQINTNTQDILNLRTDMSDINQQMVLLDSQVKDNTQKIEWLIPKVDANSQAINNLDGRVATNESDITLLESKVELNTQGITDLNNEVTALTSRVDANEQQIADNVTDIGLLDGRVLALETRPLSGLKLDTATTVTLTDDADMIVLPVFNTLVTERDGFNADPTTHTLTATVDALVELKLGLNVAFPGTETIEFQVFINGNPYDTDHFYLNGDGTTSPEGFFWTSITQLTAGDVLDVRARNVSGSVDVNINRTHFSIKAI